VSRAVTRVTTAAVTGLLTTLLTVGPAFAFDDPVGPLEGADPGSSLGPAATILLFVVTPLAVIALLALVVLLPGAVRENRYRPAEGWSADPVWFSGPADPETAVAQAQRGDVVRGGARGSW
jgi:hypothetical protein